MAVIQFNLTRCNNLWSSVHTILVIVLSVWKLKKLLLLSLLVLIFCALYIYVLNHIRTAFIPVQCRPTSDVFTVPKWLSQYLCSMGMAHSKPLKGSLPQERSMTPSSRLLRKTRVCRWTGTEAYSSASWCIHLEKHHLHSIGLDNVSLRFGQCRPLKLSMRDLPH